MSRKSLERISSRNLRAISGGTATGRMPDSARKAVKDFYAAGPKPGPGDSWIGPGKVSVRTTSTDPTGWGYKATQGSVSTTGFVNKNGSVFENEPGEY
jgi:hypothetical protein